MVKDKPIPSVFIQCHCIQSIAWTLLFQQNRQGEVNYQRAPLPVTKATCVKASQPAGLLMEKVGGRRRKDQLVVVNRLIIFHLPPKRAEFK
jgi:hypothetical protein